MGYAPKLAITGTIMLFWLSSIATSAPNTNIKQVLCNGATYSKGDPFSTSLTYVLEELVSSTPARKGYDLFNISPYPNAFAYGHGTCNTSSDLSSSECTTCLVAAKLDLASYCPSRIGGRLVLFDCQIRYEQYPFSD